jgi:hypothetical protein
MSWTWPEITRAARGVRLYHTDLAASLLKGKSPVMEEARKEGRRRREAAEALDGLLDVWEDEPIREEPARRPAPRRAEPRAPEAQAAPSPSSAAQALAARQRQRDTAADMAKIAEMQRISQTPGVDGVSIRVNSGEQFPDLFREYARRTAERRRAAKAAKAPTG